MCGLPTGMAMALSVWAPVRRLPSRAGHCWWQHWLPGDLVPSGKIGSGFKMTTSFLWSHMHGKCLTSLGLPDLINCLFFFPSPKISTQLFLSKANRWECQRSTYSQVIWCSDQSQRPSAHWKMLSRKINFLWPQIEFLTLEIHEWYLSKWTGERDGKHNNMMIIVSVYWGSLCIIHCSNHFTFNSSLYNTPVKYILSL